MIGTLTRQLRPKGQVLLGQQPIEAVDAIGLWKRSTLGREWAETARKGGVDDALACLAETNGPGSYSGTGEMGEPWITITVFVTNVEGRLVAERTHCSAFIASDPMLRPQGKVTIEVRELDAEYARTEGGSSYRQF